MPIRFRCRHCQQLMGISRRKAGMTVKCPTCHGSVVVPQPDDEAPPNLPMAEPMPEPAPPVFERSDFEAFLEQPARKEPPAPVANPFVPPPEPSSPYEAERFDGSSLALSPSTTRPRPVGLILTPTQATWLTVVAILLLALSFGAGLLIGHYWMGS
jgi:phage FluMu protein Com